MCWRSSAKSWQPSPSSNTTQLPRPRRNLPAVQPSASARQTGQDRTGPLGCGGTGGTGSAKILPLTGHPRKTVKAHTDGFHHSPSSDLSGSLSRSEHRHCPASRGIRGGGGGRSAERCSLDSFQPLQFLSLPPLPSFFFTSQIMIAL